MKAMTKTDEIEDLYELSPMQMGMVYDSLYQSKGNIYLEQLDCMLAAKVNDGAFRAAWQRVIDRHPALRTSFQWKESDRPVQVVHSNVPLEFEQQDWSGLDASQIELRRKAFLAENSERGFDISKPPLTRVALIKHAEESYEFIWTYHHAIVDGWCLPLILHEVFEHYRAICDGATVHFKNPRPYRDYIEWLQEQDIKAAEAFWRNTLKGFTEPNILTLNRPLDQQERSQLERVGLESVTVPEAATSRLASAARQQKLTLNTLVQAAWALVLSRYTNDSDIVFGGVVSGRPPEIEGVESMIGLFINTLPVRVKIDPQEKVSAWLQRLQREQAEARRYEQTSLMEIHRWSEVPGNAPLFETVLAYESYPMGDFDPEQSGGLRIAEAKTFEMANHPLSLLVLPGSGLTLQIYYDRHRFDSNMIRRLLRNYQATLEELAASPGKCLAEIEILTAAERHEVVSEWNNLRKEFPIDGGLHELFEFRVREAPERIAVVTDESQVSYAELNRRANQLAHFLSKAGLGPESFVGIYVDRSIEMIIALLGVLKSGATYVPLNPADPSMRLALKIEDAELTWVLTQQRLSHEFDGQQAQVFCLDTDWPLIENESGLDLGRKQAPGNPAYMIYTSGSTGTPKGVMVEHRAVCNSIQSQTLLFDLSPSDRILQFAPYSFDASISEIFITLSVGGALHLPNADSGRPSAEFVEMLRRQAITGMGVTPSALGALPLGEVPSLKLLVVAGEACSPEIMQRWAVGRNFFNLYGPTEGVITNTAARCNPDSSKIVIGKPIANTKAHILDSRLRLVPAAAPGEIYVGGMGLARGYLKRPDLTAESFIPDPFSEIPGARLYKTGDLARYDNDGQIDFLGRVDDQVKIRGYRIEIGEIEALLDQHPQIERSKVTVQADASGARRLVGYLVPAQEELSAQAVASYLKELLPAYMVPSAFVFLDQLPLTVNGKVDLRALPPPASDRSGLITPYLAPRNSIELHLQQIWEELLGISPVGVLDDFYDLGGHSLLVIRLLAKIHQKFGIELPLASFIEEPTIERVARGILRQPSQPAVHSPLVAIQPRGSKRPMFWVHPGSGQVLSYLALSRRMGPDQPFYGLQDPAVLVDLNHPCAVDDFCMSLEDMASRYLEALQVVQGEGPYRLGGWSFGVFVAFEMAQQLVRSGKQVELLAMLDAGPAQSLEFARIADDAKLLSIIANEQDVQITPEEIRALSPSHQLDYVIERMQAADRTISEELGPWLKRQILIFKARIQSAKPYQIQKYHGRIDLFRATVRSSPSLDAVDLDQTMGWSAVSTEPVTIHVIPGTHASIVEEPNVETLADALRARLENS